MSDAVSELGAAGAFGALVALAFLGALLVLVVDTLRTGIAPMPSSARARARMLELVPPGARGTLCELGSGWGTLAVALADRFPAADVRAYELSWVPWLFSVLRQRLGRRPNLSLRHADLFAAPLADASVVLCYLGPAAMERLATKLRRETAPGTLVISNTFGFRGWPHDRVQLLDDLFQTRVYLYRVPEAISTAEATTAETATADG